MRADYFNLPRSTRVTRATDLAAWFERARPGDRVAYHEGQLGIDRLKGASLLVEKDRRRLVAIAALVLRLAERGGLHLLQERIRRGAFRYLAVKAVPGVCAREPRPRPHRHFGALIGRYRI